MAARLGPLNRTVHAAHPIDDPADLGTRSGDPAWVAACYGWHGAPTGESPAVHIDFPLWASLPGGEAAWWAAMDAYGGQS